MREKTKSWVIAIIITLIIGSIAAWSGYAKGCMLNQIEVSKLEK